MYPAHNGLYPHKGEYRSFLSKVCTLPTAIQVQGRSAVCDTSPQIQGYLAHKKQPLLGPCGKAMPRALWWS